MSSIHYDKAIRDLIPEIIEAAGKTCFIEEVSDQEFLAKLIEKLGEEFEEFKAKPSVEELADTLEVLMAIAKYRGFDWQDVEQARRVKAENRGAFDRKLVLKRVDG